MSNFLDNTGLAYFWGKIKSLFLQKTDLSNTISDDSTKALTPKAVYDAGYLTSYTETDPVFSASPAAGITSTDISNWNGKVNKSGDTMTGNLRMRTNSIIFEDNSADYGQTITLNTSTATSNGERFAYLNIDGRAYYNRQAPVGDYELVHKKYVDDSIPKVYSSSNTGGYLTMATLPIYDGSVT